MKPDHLSETRFRDLDLHPNLLEALDKLGFEYCSPIQEKALPVALEGHDVAGQAQTGTGKTAAFLLAVMQQLLTTPRRGPEGQPRAIMLAPIRRTASTRVAAGSQ